MGAVVLAAVLVGRSRPLPPEPLRSRRPAAGVLAFAGAVCMLAAGAAQFVLAAGTVSTFVRILLEVACAVWLSSLGRSWLRRDGWKTPAVGLPLAIAGPCGGEQKKRATIIPSCSGLDTFSYLIPKYVMYPGTVFVTGFLAALISGGLCNLLFTDGKVSGGMVLLAAFLCAVYMAFFTAVYMSIGLFTSRPGVVTVFMYVGVSIVQMILMSLDLTKFHPLTLRSLVIGEMFRDDFVLADNAASIIVGIVLSLVIAVMMFVLTLSVIKSKKINNQEDKPEF